MLEKRGQRLGRCYFARPEQWDTRDRWSLSLVAGGMGPRSALLAARDGDGYFGSGSYSADRVAQMFPD